jgi:hypothetical protein
MLKTKKLVQMEANHPKYDERVTYWLGGNHLCKTEPLTNKQVSFGNLKYELF